MTDPPALSQFCGNDPKTLLEAGRYLEHRCDAIDLNLGCPQGIARKVIERPEPLAPAAPITH